MKSANPPSESPLRAKRNNRWVDLGSTDFRNSTSEVGAGAGAGAGEDEDEDEDASVGRVAKVRGWLLRDTSTCSTLTVSRTKQVWYSEHGR